MGQPGSSCLKKATTAITIIWCAPVAQKLLNSTNALCANQRSGLQHVMASNPSLTSWSSSESALPVRQSRKGKATLARGHALSSCNRSCLARHPLSHVQVFSYFPAFVAMFEWFFGVVIHFWKRMFRIANSLTDDFQRFGHSFIFLFRGFS